MALSKIQAESMNLADTYAFSGTVSGAGTKILLRDITISSATSSVEFVHGSNGVVLDSTYSRYEITLDSVIPATNASELRVFLSSNSGSSYFGNSAYNCTFRRHYSNGSSTGVDAVYANDMVLKHDDNISNTANQGGVTGTIIADNLGTAHRTVFNGNFFSYGAGNYYLHTNCIGAYESNSTTINAIKVAWSSGDIASGRFKLYGVV